MLAAITLGVVLTAVMLLASGAVALYFEKKFN